MGDVIDFPHDDSDAGALRREIRQSLAEVLSDGGMSSPQVSRTLDSLGREIDVIARIAAVDGSVGIELDAQGAQSVEEVVA